MKYFGASLGIILLYDFSFLRRYLLNKGRNSINFNGDCPEPTNTSRDLALSICFAFYLSRPDRRLSHLSV